MRDFGDCNPVVWWPTSALWMPNDIPNSKPYSEFLNRTPNSWTSLWIQKHNSEFKTTYSEYKTTHSKFKNLTLNSKISLQILKPHSKFQTVTPNSKKTHSEFQNLTPNSKTSLSILSRPRANIPQYSPHARLVRGYYCYCCCYYYYYYCYYYYYYYYYFYFHHSLFWCSLCASAGCKPCT